jgi:hypothetical protein
MTCFRKCFLVFCSVLALSLLFSMSAIAEEPAALTVQEPSTTAPAAPAPATNDDDKWHFVVAPYLWFPGLSGTTGVLGHTASVHVSAGDVLSNFNFGIMGAVEARKNRLILPVDFMWVRLKDNKGLPETDFGPTSATVRITESILTPKIGYRLADTERWKLDALFGIRYWHLGESLTLNPSTTQFSRAQNWVDFNLGMRVAAAVTPKMSVTVFGDEGAGGSRLDYQVGGFLGYRVKHSTALLLGWRYLYVDRHENGAFLDVHSSGPVLGVSFDVK